MRKSYINVDHPLLKVWTQPCLKYIYGQLKFPADIFYSITALREKLVSLRGRFEVFMKKKTDFRRSTDSFIIPYCFKVYTCTRKW